MSTLIVDASVAVKWFLPEEDSPRATGLLSSGHRLIAPDFLWLELASVLCRAHRRKWINREEVVLIMERALGSDVEMVESRSLLLPAIAIAMETGRALYDCVYLALAATQGGVCVTGDQKLVRGLAGTPFASLVKLMGEM